MFTRICAMLYKCLRGVTVAPTCSLKEGCPYIKLLCIYLGPIRNQQLHNLFSAPEGC